VIEVLNRNSKGLEGLKNGKAVKNNSLSVKVLYLDKKSNFLADLEAFYLLFKHKT
jgi:hypothetical protein